MLTAKQFSDAVLGVLQKSGWSRRGKTAWMRCPDADVVVELQKSNYDQTVFVNVGVALHCLGSVEPPKYTDCHLQFRAERLIDGFPIDLGKDIEVLRAEVQAKESTLRSLGDLRTLQKMAATGELTGGLVRKEAREILASE